jgi:esterase
MLERELAENLTVESLDGCKLNVRRIGRGVNALVLVHGFGENSYSWAQIPEQITATHTVFAVDLRGHGESGWDCNGHYYLQKFVSDVTAVIDRLAITRFAIAGHSLGADVALEIAALNSLRITKLVLVEFSLGGVAADVLEFALSQFNEQFRVYDSILGYHSLLEQQRPLADRQALRRYCENSVRRSLEGGYEVKCDPNLRRLWEVEDSTSSAYQAKAISSLTCPVLAVRGSGSAIVTLAATREIVGLAPKIQLQQVSGAGHAVMLDRPTEFYRSVCAFLLGSVAQHSAHARG